MYRGVIVIRALAPTKTRRKVKKKSRSRRVTRTKYSTYSSVKRAVVGPQLRIDLLQRFYYFNSVAFTYLFLDLIRSICKACYQHLELRVWKKDQSLRLIAYQNNFFC